VQVVRLDTPEARSRAARGKYFQIQVVPTLVVIRKGGDLQLFAGQQKVGRWLQSLASKQTRPPPETHLEPEPVEVAPEPRIRSRRKKTPVVYSSGSEEEEYVPPSRGGLYDKKPTSQPAVKPHRKSRRKSSKRHHRNRRKKPEPVIAEEYDSEEDEIEIEFVDSPEEASSSSGRPPRPSTSGLMVGPQAQKKDNTISVFDIAKKMEKERTSSLGYNEKDLPTPSY